MQEIIDFKKSNNGDFVKYSTKELIGGIHTKIDRIENKVSLVCTSVTEVKTTQVIHRRLIIALWSAMAGLLLLTLQLVGHI